MNPEAPDGQRSDDLVHDLISAALSYDSHSADLALEKAFAGRDIWRILESVAFPALREIGQLWAEKEMTVAQEHFASNAIRARLTNLAGGWSSGGGPLGILACAPGEEHDIGLLGFGLLLRDAGWRIIFLGANTPLDSLRSASEQMIPDLVMVCSVWKVPGPTELEELGQLATAQRVLLGGAVPMTVPGAEWTDLDPVEAAREFAGQ